MKIKEDFISEYRRYYFIDYKLKYFNSNNYNWYIIENNGYKRRRIKILV